MQKITENIYYVGVNDRNKSLFEGLWPLPNGVSYNSYLIDDEKVCLIDTVEVDFFTQFIEHIFGIRLRTNIRNSSVHGNALRNRRYILLADMCGSGQIHKAVFLFFWYRLALFGGNRLGKQTHIGIIAHGI